MLLTHYYTKIIYHNYLAALLMARVTYVRFSSTPPTDNICCFYRLDYTVGKILSYGHVLEA